MDILTLHIAHEVLRHRGIRAVARATGRAPSTISGAIARTEAAMAVPLVRREGANLVLTLEAELRAPHFAAADRAVAALLAEAGLAADALPPIRIETLRRLLAVARAGSIRAAARAEAIGQPQLTRQMRDLDRALGRRLLLRGPGGSQLSAEGLRLLPRAEAVVAAWERLSQAADERFRRDIATWRIGTVLPIGHESRIARMLAGLSAGWNVAQRRHRLHISSHTADELMIGLKSRRFDLILLDHPHVPRDFGSLELWQSPLALVGHEAILPPGADIRALLRTHPLALPSTRSGIRQESMAFLGRMIGPEAIRDLALVEMDSMPVIINLVAAHGHLSVLPLDSVARLPFPLHRISLAPHHVQRLVIAWRRGGGPEPLIEALRSVARDPDAP